MKQGNDITIVAIGKMVAKAMKVAAMLEKDNINVEVINARFAKPLDLNQINKSYIKTKKLVTIEDNNLTGGFGQNIKANLDQNGKILTLGYPDIFIKHSSIDEIEKQYKLDEKSIYKTIKKEFDL